MSVLVFAPTSAISQIRGEHMAKRKAFNLSEAIREHRKANPKHTAKEAFEAISKSAGHKINEGTFKSTFYKLAGQGKHRVVRRRKPGARAGAGDGAGIIARALAFIRSAGGIEAAKQVLAELEAVKDL
jgi:hypothetical protein